MKRHGTPKGLGALALALTTLLSAGCASSEAYKRALSDRDAQIRALRDERGDLKRERDELLQQLDRLEVELQEAGAPASAPAPEEASAGSYPELDKFGVRYGTRDGMVFLSIPSSITFASGQAELSSAGRQALNEVARILKAEHQAGVYYIEGHTDTDPISKSSFANNRDLSLARAVAVLTYLVEECRVPDEQCVVVGHGQYEPVDPSDTADAKAKNRRVEIVVHRS